MKGGIFQHAGMCYHVDDMEKAHSARWLSAALLLLVAAVLFGVYGVYRYQLLTQELAHTKASALVAQNTLESKITTLESTVTLLVSQLASTTEEKQALENKLGIVIEDNSSLAHQVSASQSQIEVLNKLRATDKELLVKYSKVFFLNENYTPSSLATITPSLAYDQKKTLRTHSDVQPFLEKMMRDATAAGHPLLLVSAYRSFKEQASLKSAYSMTFGSGANRFSADQGYSEHQLGTTVDFTTPALGANFSSFGGSDAFSWLTQNAYKYGFVLSYPKNNSYYVYEPWHWRFVGVVLSARLHQEGKYFYDLDQRDIDGYLIDIFTLKETMQ